MPAYTLFHQHKVCSASWRHIATLADTKLLEGIQKINSFLTWQTQQDLWSQLVSHWSPPYLYLILEMFLINSLYSVKQCKIMHDFQFLYYFALPKNTCKLNLIKWCLYYIALEALILKK